MASSSATAAGSVVRLSVEVSSDFICPWCHIAHRRLALAQDALAGTIELDVTWRPFELNPDMPVVGRDRREYRSAKFGSWEKSRQLDAGTVEAGAADDVEFDYDRIRRTPNTRAAHRLVYAAQGTGRQGELVARLLRGYFVEGDDVSDRKTLARIARDAGVSDDVVAAADRDETLDGVRVQEARALSVGLRGVPHYVIAERFGLSGAAPADELARALSNVADRVGRPS